MNRSLRPFQHITIVFFSLLGMMLIAYTEGWISWWWILILILIYIHVLVLGAIYIRWNFYMVSYDKGKNDQYITLTFDDGPAQETALILDILKAQNVKAAFFTIGKNAANRPEIVKRWHEEGHLIGNHSYDHGFNFDWKSTRAMIEEITNTNQVIANITGRVPKLFRPPYGVTNPNLARAVKHTGMYSIAWNIRSFDTKAKVPEALLSRILSRLEGGDIILLHDSMPVTREILTELIIRARQKGFTFVRLDQMLDVNAYA